MRSAVHCSPLPASVPFTLYTTPFAYPLPTSDEAAHFLHGVRALCCARVLIRSAVVLPPLPNNEAITFCGTAYKFSKQPISAHHFRVARSTLRANIFVQRTSLRVSGTNLLSAGRNLAGARGATPCARGCRGPPHCGPPAQAERMNEEKRGMVWRHATITLAERQTKQKTTGWCGGTPQ